MTRNQSMTRARAPRRRIEKVWSQIETTITTSVTALTLHTCEDSKTLVRIIAQFEGIELTGIPGFYVHLHVAPGGVTVAGTSQGSDLDNDMVDQELLTHAGVINTDNQVSWEWDSKGMRKLKTGDEIKLSTISNVASGVKLVGTVTLIFKE